LIVPAGKDLHEEMLALLFVVVADSVDLHAAALQVCISGALFCGAAETGSAKETDKESFQSEIFDLAAFLIERRTDSKQTFTP
jgi:hypothetical protein